MEGSVGAGGLGHLGVDLRVQALDEVFQRGDLGVVGRGITQLGDLVERVDAFGPQGKDEVELLRGHLLGVNEDVFVAVVGQGEVGGLSVLGRPVDLLLGVHHEVFLQTVVEGVDQPLAHVQELVVDEVGFLGGVRADFEDGNVGRAIRGREGHDLLDVALGIIVIKRLEAVIHAEAVETADPVVVGRAERLADVGFLFELVQGVAGLHEHLHAGGVVVAGTRRGAFQQRPQRGALLLHVLDALDDEAGLGHVNVRGHERIVIGGQHGRHQHQADEQPVQAAHPAEEAAVKREGLCGRVIDRVVDHQPTEDRQGFFVGIHWPEEAGRGPRG